MFCRPDKQKQQNGIYYRTRESEIPYSKPTFASGDHHCNSREQRPEKRDLVGIEGGKLYEKAPGTPQENRDNDVPDGGKMTGLRHLNILIATEPAEEKRSIFSAPRITRYV